MNIEQQEALKNRADELAKQIYSMVKAQIDIGVSTGSITMEDQGVSIRVNMEPFIESLDDITNGGQP